VNTLDDFWTNERAFGDNAFHRNEMVQMCRTEGTRIARELAETTNVGTVVHHVVFSFSWRSVREGADNVLQCLVKSSGVVKWAVQ